MLISNYVIARSDCICRAVAIPRKGSARLRLCAMMTNIANIEPFSIQALYEIPPQRRYPDRPPLMVKGTLFVVVAKRHY